MPGIQSNHRLKNPHRIPGNLPSKIVGFPSGYTPRNLTKRYRKMMCWKMYLLSNMVVLGIYLNFFLLMDIYIYKALVNNGINLPFTQPGFHAGFLVAINTCHFALSHAAKIPRKIHHKQRQGVYTYIFRDVEISMLYIYEYKDVEI